MGVRNPGIARYVHYGRSISDIPSNEELLALLDEIKAGEIEGFMTIGRKIGSEVTMVVALPVSLSEFVSSLPETVAQFVARPAGASAGTFTVAVKDWDAPTASAPTVHSKPPELGVQLPPVSEVKDQPAGRVSLMMPPEELLGPSLVTVRM